MKPLLLPCLLLSALPAAGQQPASVPPKVEGISQAAVQNAFQILHSEYIRSGELSFDELNRAALQGLLQRLDLGAGLIRKTEAPRAAVTQGVLMEKLTDQIACLRPQSFAPAESGELLARLKELADAKVPHLILDLRSLAAPVDFETAAAMLEGFVPEGEVMFKLRQVGRSDSQLFISHQRPLWTSPILVLVDRDTGNLGETLAAVLQQRKLALVIGQRTRGASVLYETRPLDDTWLMRYARAEMLLPDDTSLFERGVKPDFEVELPPEAKLKLFALENRPPLKQTVFDQPRPRYNEAALVARKNPELEEYIRRSTGQAVEPPPPVHDSVLQRAVDLCIARSHLQEAALNWGTPSAEAPPTVRKATRAP